MTGYLTQPLKRAATLFAQRTATVEGDSRRTWAEVEERVARVAQGLLDLGLQVGDRVAVLSFNSARYFELHFALPWAGATMVPLNTRLAPAEIEFQIHDSAPKILFIEQNFVLMLDKMNGIAASFSQIIVIDAPADRDDSYEALIERSAPGPDRCPAARVAGRAVLYRWFNRAAQRRDVVA